MEWQALAKLVAPLVTAIIILAIRKYLEDRPKLITYLVHASAIPLNDDRGTEVNTHSIVVRNSGKRTAHNVRIGHNYLPKSYQLFPLLNYDLDSDRTEQAAEICLPTLVPGESVNISYLYFPPITWDQIHSYCKSDEMSAKHINIVPTPQPGKLQVAAVWTLIFIGASTIVYGTMLFAWRWLT